MEGWAQVAGARGHRRGDARTRGEAQHVRGARNARRITRRCVVVPVHAARRITGAGSRSLRAVLREAIMKDTIEKLRPLGNRLVPLAAIFLLVLAMGGTWQRASAAPPTTGVLPGMPAAPEPPAKRKELTGKINLNTATGD